MLHLLIIERGRCQRCWKEESFREKQNKSSEDELVRLRVENQNDFNRNKEIKSPAEIVRILVFLVWKMFDLMVNIICEFYDHELCYPNLTTRNTLPAMTISIKQVNGDLISVTMQGDLAIHPDLLPLQDVSVVPNCEMNLLSVAHMCETWDASVVLDSDQICVMKKKINLSDSQTILSGPQNNGLYYLALPSRTNHQQSYIAEEVTYPKNETPEDASSSQPLCKKRIRRTLCPIREKEWKYWHNRLCHFSGLKRTINACEVARSLGKERVGRWRKEGKERKGKERKRKVKSKSWERLVTHRKGKPTK